jgi:tetratricopeptide (TPR) repeat protein
MKKILYILSIILFVSQLSAQNVEFEKKNFKNRKDAFKIAKKNLEQGDELYAMDMRGDYKQAIDYYLKANQFNPNNALLNYKIGVCYLKSVSQEKALDYLL